MKRWIIFLIVLNLTGCRTSEDNSFLTPEKATLYFSKIEHICNRDDGKLWGENLYGPIMLVDRSSRRIIANRPDSEGILKARENIYTGLYPKEMVINIRAVEFGGSRFALVPISSQDDESMILPLAISGLYRLFHESKGYESSDFNTSIMDEKNARIWLKLEWKALRKALETEGPQKRLAIRDALIFRGANHETYPNYIADGISFENHAGLTFFTGNILSTDSPEEYKQRLFESLERIYFFPSYARSYGAIHGALYATLLWQKGYDFALINSENADLAGIVKEQYNIQCPEVCRDVAGSIAVNYELETILEEETVRDEAINEWIHRRISKYVERPVVVLELESPYFDFEQEDIRPLDTLGTIYNKIRISDNWGKLTVDKGGCLLSNNLRFVRITAKGYKEDRNRIEGEGWNLILNNGWQILQIDENYVIKRRL